MKKISILFAFVMAASLQMMAQKVWTEPPLVTNPDDTLKIYVDLTQMDCDKLVGNPGPLYIWTWMPNDPVNGNGQWDASNTDNAWTNVSPDVWMFKMVPTEFYGATAADVFDKDIHFLVKALDGGSGGDCSAAGDENKTEDLMVAVDPPAGGLEKVYAFPDFSTGDSIAIRGDDMFTLVYENSLEEKPSMQNPGDLYVYARAYDTDGAEYRPATIGQVGTLPQLKMSQNGDQYKWTIWPNEVFSIPAGKTLDYLKLQIMKPNLVNGDDAVDGTFNYWLRCD